METLSASGLGRMSEIVEWFPLRMADLASGSTCEIGSTDDLARCNVFGLDFVSLRWEALALEVVDLEL